MLHKVWVRVPFVHLPFAHDVNRFFIFLIRFAFRIDSVYSLLKMPQFQLYFTDKYNNIPSGKMIDLIAAQLSTSTLAFLLSAFVVRHWFFFFFFIFIKFFSPCQQGKMIIIYFNILFPCDNDLLMCITFSSYFRQTMAINFHDTDDFPSWKIKRDRREEKRRKNTFCMSGTHTDTLTHTQKLYMW